MGKSGFVLASVAVGLVLSACSEQKAVPLSENPTERAIQERIIKFKEMGELFKEMDDEIKASSPDVKKLLADATKIATLGNEIPNWFPAGTGPDSGFETAAKPELWSDNPRFIQVHQEFQAESQKLLQAAASENMDDLTSQYYTMGVACANCHKPFRIEKE